MLQNETYRERGRSFLQQAFAELEADDLLQASEKGWGAAAQMVKAVAAERGWEHHGHRLLHVALGRMAAETQNESLSDGFMAATNLHINFYEGWLDKTEVVENLELVRAFVEAAEGLLSGHAW